MPARKRAADDARSRTAGIAPKKASARKTAATKTSARKGTSTKAAAKKTTAARTSAKKAAPAAKRASKETIKSSIVTAALQLFESKGFDATTTREIAVKAKVAEGTVFNYFETKEDIALHFFELEVDHAIETVRADVHLRSAPLEEKLFTLVQTQIDYLAPYERFIGSSMIAALRPTSKIGFSVQSLALRNRYLAFVQELIDESLPEGGISTLSWIAPQAFWIYYVGVLLYWLYDASPGKQNTLAFLDRSLKLGVAVLRKGTFV